MNDDERSKLGHALSELSQEVVPALAETWKATPSHETNLRWALVYSAAMAGPAAVPFLREVIQAPVLPEQSPDPDSYSTKSWDSIVRSRAVGGLESLTAAGSQDAESALFACLTHELFSIRALSAIALVHLDGGEERRTRVRTILPEAERSVVDTQRVRPGVVPQVRNPREHLVSLLGHRNSLPPQPAHDLEPLCTAQTGGPKLRRSSQAPQVPPNTGAENG